MQATAKLSYLRMSPKKVRLVVDMIRGMKVEEAIIQLNMLNKAAKRPVLKLLDSAIANAENNFELKKDNLFIKEIRVNQAGMLKRWQSRAHGRATPLRKKLSHVHIILEEIKPTKAKAKKKDKKEEKVVRVESLEKIKKEIKPKEVLEARKDLPIQEGHEKEIDKEIFDKRMEGKHRHQQHQDKATMKKDKGFITKLFNRKSG